MERLMKAINENLEDPKFSVEDLAEAVGVSRVQLHRKLKVLTQYNYRISSQYSTETSRKIIEREESEYLTDCLSGWIHKSYFIFDCF